MMFPLSRSGDHVSAQAAPARRIVVIAGPTAVGKSALALALAERVRIGIVNADAMQLYRGMDIGTAKATAAERRTVPHVGLDVLPVTESASVAWYRSRARAGIAELWASGRTPVVVGGSRLYLRAICDELDIPPTDPVVREKYSERLSRIGAPALHAQLRELAPEAADHIAATNGRRIVRALEVIELTGEFRARMPPPTPWAATLWLGLDMDRDDLDARIARRVSLMWTGGLIDEVRALRAAGLTEGATAQKAVGYLETLDHLAGGRSAEQAQQDIVSATRRLARRQRRSFRGDPRIKWLPAGDPDLVEQALVLVQDFLAGPDPTGPDQAGERSPGDGSGPVTARQSWR